MLTKATNVSFLENFGYPSVIPIKNVSRCNVVVRLARQKALRKEIAKLKRQKRKLVSNERICENMNSNNM